MADTIINGTLFNADNIKYSPIKANPSGGKSINLLYRPTSAGIRLSMEQLLTWGASDYVDDSGKGNGKFEMSLQFPNDEEEKTPETRALLENLIKMERKIKTDAFNNSKEWFGKVLKNEDVVEALWTPMLKYSRNKNTGEPDYNRAPVLRVKLPQWEGKWKSEVYDEEGTMLFPDESNPDNTPLDFIRKGSQVATIIQCGGIWFANGKFGITWKLVQAAVPRPKPAIKGTCFIKLKGPLVPAPAEVESNPTQVNDSDDEDSSPTQIQEAAPVVHEEAVQQEATPVATTEKKKAATKKK